ncbi:lactonase family protein [Subtercola endophyticus]|uniref:lactonase family protein n=1 Tax=Subtercola endophyticus TaxID=2895559 RepID=UPI001E533DD9|nr:beta-propeller fold lactonase family protein [Subtercola endophyticus]UFS58462.1 lactonase family protein [Subtercola endophyticus]
MEPSREIWVGTYTTDSGRDGVGIGALRLSSGGAVRADAAVNGVPATVAGDGATGSAGATVEVGGDAVTGAAASPGVIAAVAGDAVTGITASTGVTAEWLGRAVEAPSPSFVAVHPSLPIVYAVAERAETVAAYRRVDASVAGGVGAGDTSATESVREPTGVPQLEPFGEPWPAGAAVCHISVDPQGRYAVACCWGDGQVVLYELDSDGAIVDRFVGTPATDPHAEAAAAEADVAGMLARTGFAARTSRAHCSLVLPDGRIMTTDLGFDLVRVWTFVPGAGLALDHELELPFWSGPRHLVAHPNGSVLIVTEYSVEVVVLTPQPAGSAEPAASGLPRYTVAQISPATARGARPLDGGAEIALSDDARFVYVTVRGSNSVTTLRVDDRGHVHPLADLSTGGDWPRHHVVLGSALLIAHERSSQVTLFALDASSGLPSGPTQQLAVEAPTALIPA